MKRRVAITGLGSVTSLGIGVNEFWKSIKNGKCGISRIERIDVSDLPTTVGAEIKDFQPLNFIEKKEIKRMDRYAQYAMAAAQMAVEESGLDVGKVNKERMGVIIGSGVGGIETMENQHNVPNEGKAANIACALTNSLGFGGHNAALVLKAFCE